MDRLAERFFNILEEGGEYVEIFAIRDLMMSEYISGRRSQVEVLQIDDIIEESIYNVRDEGYNDSEEARIIASRAYELIDKGDIDGAFDSVNLYGSSEINGNAYVYYCLVKALEKLTGENYIEICI